MTQCQEVIPLTSDVVEVLPVYAEQSPSHGRRPHRDSPVSLPPVQLPLRDSVPTEVKPADIPRLEINIEQIHRYFQLNPPQVMSLAVMYSKLSSEMTSMTGHTTALRLAAGKM